MVAVVPLTADPKSISITWKAATSITGPASGANRPTRNSAASSCSESKGGDAALNSQSSATSRSSVCPPSPNRDSTA